MGLKLGLFCIIVGLKEEIKNIEIQNKFEGVTTGRELKLGLFCRSVKGRFLYIILVFIRCYVHFGSLEIGFVLHFYGRLGGSEVVGMIGFVLQGAARSRVLIIRC